MPSKTLRADTFVVGSGPVGCAFARTLVQAGQHVVMIDAGPLMSPRPGAHLKNSYQYQRNVDLFTSVIQGHLHLLSVPPNDRPEVTLDPSAYRFDRSRFKGFVTDGQNPEQDPQRNLDAEAVTYGVGGMATHWTCATPRHHPVLERSDLLTAVEWNELYQEAEKLLNTRTDAYDMSVRHRVVHEALSEEFTELRDPYQVRNLPLAVERRTDDPSMVHWSGADTVLGPLAIMNLEEDCSLLVRDEASGGSLTLYPEHLCRRLALTPDGERVEYAEVVDLTRSAPIRVEAGNFVVAGGAVLTPQLLSASRVDRPALGRYLHEQPVSFCQIVFHQALVDSITADERFTDRVNEHHKRNPEDPVPIPEDDPEPNVWIPVGEQRPWHCQIHRDAFHYGGVPPNVDSRLIVDLRWFGMIEPRAENRMTFSGCCHDTFGMPQVTFDFTLTPEDRATQHRMMRDMLRAASVLGGFLPGSEPRFVAPGLPLHITGTTRMGTDSQTSVVDTDSRVWGVDNLYLGGNNVIPGSNASNPTLTSVALAVKSARRILSPAPA
ncbi:pyranose oxidase [Streptomyces carminius]|uniref:Pyranose 2-oxidase n=1 Tax=Streptomyces carminius TaxID=2665496 RepID=A0A2M8M076_9ACTN|nr:pyranose oxidase [Streptomyces carminius]PJE97613.1 pyranose oxidase [Streptomyces carminius]